MNFIYNKMSTPLFGEVVGQVQQFMVCKIEIFGSYV